MGKLFNRVQQGVTGAPGTGPFTMGAPASGKRTLAQAGAQDGDLVSGYWEEGTSYEFGEYTYSSTGQTLTRTNILGSSNGGLAVSFGAGAVFGCDMLKEDFYSALFASNNLADLADKPTARTNLGLTAMATIIPGTGVAAALAAALNVAGGLVGFSALGSAAFVSTSAFDVAGAAATLLSSGNTWTARQTFNAGVTMGGNIFAGSWGLNGLKLIGGGSTLTDTSGAGTVASGASGVLGGDTIAATNARTLTDYYSVYIKDPIAGTNVTLTNKWSLGLEGNLSVGGRVLLGNGARAQPAITFAGATTMGFWNDSNSQVRLSSANSDWIGFTSSTVNIPSVSSINWNSDLYILRDAPNTLALRNGTNAQAFLIYNTYTDASNYERGGISWSSNTMSVFTTGAAGTGVGRDLILSGATVYLRTASTNRWQVDASGHFLAVADNAYDIGASGATRPRTGYFGTSVRIGAVSSAAVSLSPSLVSSNAIGGHGIFEMTAANSSGSGGGVLLYQNSGSAATSGTRLGLFLFGGVSDAGVTYRNSAIIHAFATENWTGSAYGTRLEFGTTANGSTTRTTRLIIGNSGIITLGATEANTVPALKPSSTTMQARLGDDSAFAPFQASTLVAGSPTAAAVSAGFGIAASGAGSAHQLVSENTVSNSSTSGGVVSVVQNGAAALVSGDRIGLFVFSGSSNASTLRSGACLAAFATQTWSEGSAYGTRFELQTVSNGATTRTTKLIIGQGGIITFGATEASTVPALKPSSAVLQARLGDDSAYAVFDAIHRLQGAAPATASDTGTAGDIRYDSGFVYICTAANTWKRVAIATF